MVLTANRTKKWGGQSYEPRKSKTNSAVFSGNLERLKGLHSPATLTHITLDSHIHIHTLCLYHHLRQAIDSIALPTDFSDSKAIIVGTDYWCSLSTVVVDCCLSAAFLLQPRSRLLGQVGTFDLHRPQTILHWSRGAQYLY